jgi:hypothetical protein
LNIFTQGVYAQSSADFSGKWAFDISKSKPGEGSSFGSSDITHIITQKPSSITITETIGQQENSIIETFLLDGKATVENKGSRIVKKSAAWSKDKKALTLTTIMTIDGNDYRSDDTYKLSDNRVTLTVQSVLKDKNGVSTVVWVYNKKKN